LTTNLSIVLEPTPPFRLDITTWTLRRRPDNIIDRWDGRVYRRVLIKNDQPFEIAVSQFGDSHKPQLQLEVTSEFEIPGLKEHATSMVERLLGIHINLGEFYRFGENDEMLNIPLNRFRGLKPPRFPTYFEALANAIACQQLTLTVGIRLLNSLAERYGPTIHTSDGTFYGFPRPQDLAKADKEELRAMGFSYQKASYLIGLSQAISNEELDLEEIAKLGDEDAVKQLCTMKGVGRWTAEYFLLRGLGRTHVFPGDDVGARKNLESWLDLPEKLNYDGVHETLKPWNRYGGLIYFHLLLKSLTEKGTVPF